jgi:hypothetical protein
MILSWLKIIKNIPRKFLLMQKKQKSESKTASCRRDPKIQSHAKSISIGISWHARLDLPF